jgi:phage shock protein E
MSLVSRVSLLLLLPLTTVAACSATTPAAAVARTADTIVIDVRTADEWASGHADHSTLIPVDELEARIAEVDTLVGGNKARPIVVVCRSGGRAARAKALLQAKGFTHVDNGGAWQNMR